MKMTDMRAKARAIFGPAIAEPMPKQPNGAKALQERANARPIPTYKVGGSVKKPATPPGPTQADREADRKRREDLAKAKVTQKEADTLGRAMRSEGPRYKDGGKIAKYKQGSGGDSVPLQNLDYNLVSGGNSGGGGGRDFRISPTIIKTQAPYMGGMAGSPPKAVGIKLTKRFKDGGKSKKDGLSFMTGADKKKSRTKKMDGGEIPTDMRSSKLMADGGKPMKKAAGGAAKVRKGMMTPEGKITHAMNKIRDC